MRVGVSFSAFNSPCARSSDGHGHIRMFIDSCAALMGNSIGLHDAVVVQQRPYQESDPGMTPGRCRFVVCLASCPDIAMVSFPGVVEAMSTATVTSFRFDAKP